MRRDREMRATSPLRRACAASAAVAAVAMLWSAATAAPRGDADSAALRRACATGALTPYICAKRGIPSPGEVPPVAAPSSSPPPAPAPAAPAPATPVGAAPAPAPAEPARPRNGRRRGQADAGLGVRPFQDTRKRYDLQIPEGWELKMQGGFAAFGHGDDWIQLRATPAATPEAAAAAGVDLLRDQYVGFTTSADAPVTVGGRAGRRLVLSAKSKAGRPSSLVVVAAPMSAGSHLVVIGGGGPEDAAVIEAGVSDLVRTLHFH